MAKRSHVFLQEWYKNFAKELYEKANIDVTRIEDICRVRNFEILSWDPAEPLDPSLDYKYAFIPQNERKYDNPPPSIENADAYLDWVMNHLQVPTSDEQIEKLLEMSMAGTLFVYTPKLTTRQVYTDEFGNIITSPILETMSVIAKDVPEHLRLPEPPKTIDPADPKKYGLQGCPEKPVPPKDMNPGFFSWLGYKLGINTAYAKKVRYEKDVETYDERFQKWFDGLDDQDVKVTDYKLHHLAREEYLREVEQEYMKDRLGIATSLLNGFRLLHHKRIERESELAGDLLDENWEAPTAVLATKEGEMWKKQHEKLPQGQMLKNLDQIEAHLRWEKRSRRALTDLLGHDPTPDSLTEYTGKVFKFRSYKPTKYAVPEPPQEGYTEEERLDFKDRMRDVAKVASFAALSHPDVAGETLRDGFNKEESAKLNYTMILQNVMTGARPGSQNYMDYFEPARQKGRVAMEAYARGELEPLAELLRTSIRQTNREAADLADFNSDHSLNTLYYIGRMYKLMQNDPKLAEAVGLTPEELAETKGNAALHKTMTKALQAKKMLLEYSLYMREMTPEQLREAATDIRFASSIAQEIEQSHEAQTEIVHSTPEYEGYLREMEQYAQTDPDKYLQVQDKMKLAEFERKGCENNKNLADEKWVESAKAAIAKNCNIDQITTMKREALAELISPRSNTAFDEAFKFIEPNHNVRQQEVPEPVRANNAPDAVLS